MQLTIGPLQQKLGSDVAVNTNFLKGDEDQMVTTALKSAGAVLGREPINCRVATE